MFNIGDYVIYGSNGVCKVESVGTVDTPGIPKNREYYTLIPVYLSGSKLYVPVDSKKANIRHILTKDEANSLVEDFNNIETLWVADDKKRAEIYKDAIRKYDCRELVRIIKTLYMRKKERIAEGKKFTAGDENYFKLAEDNLFGELAVSLDMEKSQVKDYLVAKVE